jgi:CubicO group peptidase (beta-lactamase class C family)
LLADAIEALSGSPLGEQPGAEILERLFSAADASSRRPALRRGQPASFVVLTPGEGGTLDPATTRIDAVFLNGCEVTGETR